MSDSWDIDAAVIATLQADATLKTLCPDGVWYSRAAAGLKRFVIVSIAEPRDASTFGGRAIEIVTYLVKAVGWSDIFTVANQRAAAKRIDELLHDATLTPNGYVFMDCVRDDDQPRVRYDEPDAVDASKAWRHGGGHYRVRVTFAAT